MTNPQDTAIRHIDELSHGTLIDVAMRITLNFHPDRVYQSLHILDDLARGGIYKSQFETQTSNGGLTAHPGGDRWRWENRIFGGAYDTAPASDRPKYGALNYKNSQYGGSPRFGSAYLRLKQQVLERSTFCYPDSAFEPEAFGTARHFSLAKLALVDDKDLLDDYIEAQVHGKYLLEWHEGFVLSIDEMAKYPEYRGSEYVQIGREIAIDGLLTPKIIGDTAALKTYDQQALKRVWHYLARFGQKV